MHVLSLFKSIDKQKKAALAGRFFHFLRIGVITVLKV